MYRIRAGLSREIVEEISARKNDPKWMRDFRLKCLQVFDELKMPSWGPDLSGLDIDNIASYVRSSDAMVESWDDVPEDIRKTFDALGIPAAEKESLAGVGAQYDSELVYHNIKSAVAERGVVYMGIEEALHSRKYSKLIREHFMKLITPRDHKIAALHGAVWSGGSFVYVPKNTCVEFPLQSYFRFNAPGAGQFEHTLIIVDEGADLHFIEGCSAPKYNVANLHAGCVEIFVGKNASVKYSTVESWSKNMYNLNSKRALVAEGGRMEWVTGSFGSHISMLYPMTILDGDNSSAEYTGVSFAGAEQDLDTGVKVLHRGKNTASYVCAKSLSKNGGKNTFRSSVVIDNGAKNAKSFTKCESLILDADSHSNTVPYYDVREASADVAHEASVGKIGEREIEYLRARGLSDDAARALIVRGFASDVSKELPLEYAMEMNNYIQLEMENLR